MRLISLELHGFKSFPDKTLLKFAPGVTTVVGPNGSGKSNISDAVRWVLGELSTKSIRGSKMEDVVFSGADSRKPMSFAEVSITFDNREEAGFSRLASDYDEVTVTRRYNRNGSSEYMINRRPARRQDILTLFMNTGVGRDGYSIVSQGKAAEIISQKSDERRNVFEEAAGISKYRYQKTDAEKKLAETSLNCERLADILAEKKHTLHRLERDAEKARQFIEVYEKKKEADVSLSVYDISCTKSELSEKKEKFEVLARSLNIADNEITDDNNEYERLDIEKNRVKEKSSALTGKIEDMANDRYSSDTRVQVLKNDLEHLTKNISATKEKLSELSEALKEYNASADKASEALTAVRGEHDARNAENDKLAASLEAMKADMDKLELDIEAELELSDTLNDKLSRLRIAGAELEGSESSSVSRRAELEKEIEDTKRSTETSRSGMEQYKRRMDDYTAKSDKLKAIEEQNNAEADRLRREQEELNQKIVTYASDIRDVRTRIDSLRRMEELFEGYPHSVSALMSASKAGKIKGIIGPLSHIFSVKGDLSLAIETALGANIQNIVTETDEAAKSAILWLKQNNAGRATFYPLNTMQVTPLAVNEAELKKHKGYIGIASELIEYDAKFDRVIKNLLGRTLVFDNIDNANATSKAYGYRIRIVTKDGQLINAGGSFTGGAAKRESGVLNRAATIEKLSADRLKLEGEKKIAEDKHEEVTEKLGELLTRSQDNQSKLKIISSLYQADLTHYTAFEAQLNTVNENIAKLEEQLADIDSSENRLKAEKERIASEIEDVKLSLEKCEMARVEKTEKRAQMRAQYDEKTGVYNKALIDIAGLKKDVDAAMRELELRIEAKTACEAQIDSAKQSIENDNESIRLKNEEIVRHASQTQAFADTIAEMTAERDEAEKLGNEIESKMSALKKQITDKMSARESLSNEYTKIEGRIENLTEAVDSRIAYLLEEYKLTFSDAEALNYPAVTSENRKEIEQTLTELKEQLRKVGNVDPNSIEEYKVAKVEYDDMSVQFDDLTKSREEFENTIEILEREMTTKFVEVMAEINIAFKRVFRELFGGGNAELVLTDPDDVLHCGIDINVAPPGKIIKNLSLLSGGEQAFISIALFFAILHVNPSPFCIFDEIEAALDEVNVAMFANYIKKYSDKTQFITITHRRGTMEVADTLYGVTMAERGISKVLTLNVNEVESKLGVKL
ncbi:MAG: chromosome segregation protein SMC [Clostridia bacterium]|nr:chromosome segregation protein SMC [Clostridia bacterium]